MMHGCENSNLVIEAMNPANKARKCPLRRHQRWRSQRCRWSETRGPRGNTHQQSTCRAQNTDKRDTGDGSVYGNCMRSHTRGKEPYA